MPATTCRTTDRNADVTSGPAVSSTAAARGAGAATPAVSTVKLGPGSCRVSGPRSCSVPPPAVVSESAWTPAGISAVASST